MAIRILTFSGDVWISNYRFSFLEEDGIDMVLPGVIHVPLALISGYTKNKTSIIIKEEGKGKSVRVHAFIHSSGTMRSYVVV